MVIWVKLCEDTRLLNDLTYEDYGPGSRTDKIMKALEEACKKFDLSVPIWLDVNINDFHRNSKTRFTKDSFIEHIDFDYLELQVIEEDW